MTTMDKVGSLEEIFIDALIPYARNSRTHSDSQVAQIAASIKEFGFTNPVLVDEDGGIIAGHGRVLAARKLQLNKIPCIKLLHLTHAQKQAYVIADNKLALNASWDFDLLKIEVSELSDMDFDMSLLGFDSIELNALLSGNEIEDEEEDEPKEVNFTIQYNIIFDHEQQQDDWFRFVRYLKNQFPDGETLAERLQLFIKDNDYGAD